MAVRHTVAHQRKRYNFQKTKWICQRQLILFIFKLPWKETVQLTVERKNFGLSFCMFFFQKTGHLQWALFEVFVRRSLLRF